MTKLDDRINEEYERCYNVGFNHGLASQYVECKARIEAAFRAGAESMRREICSADGGEIEGLADRDEIWEFVEDTSVDIDALWAEYKKGGE